MEACNCPKPTSLTEIVSEDCGVDLKQIQRIAFERIGNSFDTTATPATDILSLADWQAKMNATDDTKIVITPLIGGDPLIEAGDAITNGGGDNSTLDGEEEVTGTNPALFSCMFKSLSSVTEKALKKLVCERRLNVYFILQGGRIAAYKLTDDSQRGFQVSSIFVGDRDNDGFGTNDTVSMRFQLKAGYSTDLEVYTPNFDPLTEI